ncbi:WD repeat-containing protein 92 [Podila verticillata]|nr:WD repeat-containing protein 92 [Podila verticillata]
MTSSPKITQVASKPIPFTGFQALWVPGTTRVCTFGSSDAGFGVIQVHALSTSSSTSKSPIVGGATTSQTPKLILHSETEKKSQFKCGTFRAGGSHPPRLVTGDFDGRVGLWDLNRTEVPLSLLEAHTDIVTCIDGAGGTPGAGTGSLSSSQPRQEFVTGCRDGTVKVWDTRQKEQAVSVMAPKKGYGHEVWSVSMNAQSSGPEDLLVVAGYDNGDIRVLDLVAGKPLFETNIKHGVCSVEFDRTRGTSKRLIATTMEGTLHSFDLDGSISESKAMAEETITVQTGDESTLWQARHVPQRQDIFAVTDGGGNIHLYEHGNAGSLIKSLGSHQFAKEAILSLEFNDDLEGLFVACDLNNTLRIGMLNL